MNISCIIKTVKLNLSFITIHFHEQNLIRIDTIRSFQYRGDSKENPFRRYSRLSCVLIGFPPDLVAASVHLYIMCTHVISCSFDERVHKPSIGLFISETFRAWKVGLRINMNLSQSAQKWRVTSPLIPQSEINILTSLYSERLLNCGPFISPTNTLFWLN